MYWWPWQGEHLYKSLCCYLQMTVTRGAPVYIFWWPWQEEQLCISSDDLDKRSNCVYLLMTLTMGTPVYITVLLSSDDLDKGNTCIHPCVVILWWPWQGNTGIHPCVVIFWWPWQEEHLYTSLCCYRLMTLTRGAPVYIPVFLSSDDLDKGNTCIHPCVLIFWWPWQWEHLYTSPCCYRLMTLTMGTPVYIPVLLSSDDLDNGNTCIHPCVVIFWWPWQEEHLYTSLCCYLMMTLTRGTPVYIPVLLSSDDLDKRSTCIRPCVVIFWWPWQGEHLYTSLCCYLLMTLTTGAPVYVPVLVVIFWWPWQGEHLYTSLCCYLLMTLTRGTPVYIPVLVVIFWWPWQGEHLYTSLCWLLSYDDLDKGSTCIHPCVVIFWLPWQGEHLYTSLCWLLSSDDLDKRSTCIHPCVVIFWWPWQGEHLYTSLCCYLLMTLTRGAPVYIPVLLSYDDLDKRSTCIHPCVVILWWPWQEEHLYTSLCCYLLMTLTMGTPVYIPVLLSSDDLDKGSTCIHPCVVIFWWPWQWEHLYTSLCCYLMMSLTRGTLVYIPVLLSYDDLDNGNTCIHPCIVIFWWPWQGEHLYTSLCCYLLMTLTRGNTCIHHLCCYRLWWPWQGEHLYTSLCWLLSYDDLDKGNTCIHHCVGCYLLMTLTRGAPVYIPVLVVILWCPWQGEHLFTSLCWLLSYDDLDKRNTCIRPCVGCYLMMSLTRGTPVYVPVLVVIFWWPWQGEHLYTSLCWLLSSDDLDKGNTCIHPCVGCYLLMTLTRGATVYFFWWPWQWEHLYTSLYCYLLMTLTMGTPVYIPVLLSYDDLDKGNTCIHPCVGCYLLMTLTRGATVYFFWWPWQWEHLYTSLYCYLLMTLTRGTPVYIPVLLSSDDLDKGNTCIHHLCCYLLMTLTRGAPVYIPVLLSSDYLDKGNTCIHPWVVIFWWPWQEEHLYTSLCCYLLMTLTRGTPVYIPVLSSDDLDKGSTCIHPCVVILWWPWQGEHLYTSLCCYLMMSLTRGTLVYIPVLLSYDDLDNGNTCIHPCIVIFWWPWQGEHLYTSLCCYLLMTLTRGTPVYITVLLSSDDLDKGSTCIHPCVVILWWPWQGEHLYTSLCCYLLMTLTRGAPVYIPVLLSSDDLDKGNTCIHPCVVILWCPWQGEHLYTSLCWLLSSDDLDKGNTCIHPCVVIFWWPWQGEHLYTSLCWLLSSDDLDKGNTCIHPCVVIFWWPWQGEHLYTSLCCYLLMTLTMGTPVYVPVLVVIFWWPWQGEHLYTSLCWLLSSDDLDKRSNCVYLLMTLTMGTPVYITVGDFIWYWSTYNSN